MSEWWTYRPSDFVMFSARSYYRLFELYNAALWPAHAIAIALGVTLVATLAWASARHPMPAWPQRVGCVLLAAAWLWVGVGYHAQRFASINSAASGYAVAFALQGMLLLALALGSEGSDSRRRATHLGPDACTRWTGLGLLAYAVFLHPLVGSLFGRPIGQAEVAGLAPDPTAVATLGLLLLLPRAHASLRRGLPRVAWAVALAWCALSSLTLATLSAPEAWALPMLCMAAVIAAWWRARQSQGQPD